MFKGIKRVLGVVLASAMIMSTGVSAIAATSPATAAAAAKQDVVATNGAVVDTQADKTAVLEAVAASTVKKYNAPNTATVNGVEYKITVVDAKAFANATKATKIRLGADVDVVKKQAFSANKKLKSVVIRGTKLVKFEKGAFKGLKTKKMKVYVNRKMSKKNYKKLVKALRKAGFKGKIAKIKTTA